MNITGMQGKQIALEIRILALHSTHVPGNLVHHIGDGGLGICQQIPVAGLLKTLGRKIYLKPAGRKPFACKP